jgi:uncharacterized phiE125 gp8 family phage protein
MSLQLITPPAAEPVTLADAKAHLKIETTDEDALITTLMTAARARAEWHTGRAFITQSWILRLDAWPQDGIAEIPLPPLQAVTEVAVISPYDIRTVLNPLVYRVDTASGPGRVIFAAAPPSLRNKDCVEIAFTAGYGAASAVPAAVREAILEVITDLYTHRGEDSVTVGLAGQALLAPYRIFKL